MQPSMSTKIQFAVASLLMTASGVASAGIPTSTVPEPGPMGLLALGCVALVIARRFSRKK